jgi:Alpha/beta hydrolase domain
LSAIGPQDHRRRGLPLALLIAAALLASASPALAADVKPFTASLPHVTGPIPSTSTNFPFIADGFNVEPSVPEGYVENEYFVSGTGNLYQYTPTGIEVVTPCPSSTGQFGCTNIPYTTRMLVKRPKDPRKFSGTVVVEPLNPSAGSDIAAVWDRSWRYFVRQGDIFVGWTSRLVALNALKQFNPQRYAPLTWGVNSVVDDGITFDIAAQMGALFKRNGRGSPIHRYRVKRVFEAGFSQDGGFTFTQADVFNKLERLPAGGPVYNGYVPGGTTGPSNIDFGLTPAGALPAGDPRHQMQPRDVPVIQINTETEEALGAPTGLTYRRPDSNARGDRYRLWEVPGASHVSNDLHVPVITLELNQLELNHLEVAHGPPVGCTHQVFAPGPSTGLPGVIDPNPFPFSDVANAAFADLTRWVDGNGSPPHAPPIDVSSGAIVRDQFGNSEGGLRTPFVDDPTGTYAPTDTVAHATAFSGFCVLFGYETPFDHATLRSIYSSHTEYVHRVTRESERLVKQGFWLQRDARQVISDSRHADVP